MKKFSEFFENWLHQNYYKKVTKIGKEGDFFTAVSVGNLFGTLIVQHFLDLIDKKILTPPLQVVEIGANEGYLSKDFLSALLEFRPELFKEIEFYIIEPHSKLQNLQKHTLQNIDFHHKNSLKECEFENAFIFCNELFDSFSCELINEDKMAFIEDFEIHFLAMDDYTKSKCQELKLLKGELSFALEDFFKDLNKACKKFILAGFDYGVLNPNSLSLRIYQNHKIFNPFTSKLQDFFGQSDLTYDINFTHLYQLCDFYNFKILSFEKQKEALLHFGFEKILKYTQDKNIKSYENFLQQAKYLFFHFNDKFHFFEIQKA